MLLNDIDEIDIEILNENYDQEILSKIDINNANKIYKYLIDNGIYFAKDIFLGMVDIFFVDYRIFVRKFDKLKLELGDNYIEQLERNPLLLEKIYTNN